VTTISENIESARQYALEMDSVSKTFDGTAVLHKVSLRVKAGEVRALVGENGSGKSTLMKILAGFHEPDPGATITVNGQVLTDPDPKTRLTNGLRFVHQDLGLVHDLDVMDNLALGQGFDVGRFRRISWKKERVEAEQSLDRLGYDIDVSQQVGSLTISQRTAVAIARALSERHGKPNVLVLDEPTANLPAPEVERLFELLRRVKATGVAIIFISHHLGEVFDLADSATILRDGRAIVTRPVEGMTEDDLIETMIGRRLEHSGGRGSAAEQTGEALIEIEGLSGRTVRSMTFRVASGEVVGIAGITGSGREEVVPLLSGDVSRTGSVHVSGGEVPGNRPDLNIGHGIACVPAERVANVALQEHSVRENVTISNLRPFVRGTFLSKRRERSDVDRLLREFDVRPRRSEGDISTLSGGNQQKVMMARALRLDPKVLILDEPTQGVDVGAQSSIHDLVRSRARAGAAVVVCSSVNEELAEIADRVLVMTHGRVTAELFAPLDADRITAATIASRTEETA
jgi:ribose transport system ATP-binding protein